MFIGRYIGGGFTHQPEDMSTISDAAKQMIKDSFADISPLDPTQLGGGGLVDTHSHLGGLGVGGTGCCLNEGMTNTWNPYKIIKFHAFMQGAGVQNLDNCDREYAERLVKLIRCAREHGPWGKHFLLAMDAWYEEDGIKSVEKTGLYVPNEYVMKIVEEFPDCFEPCISVHPYRADAIDELDRYAKKGVRMVKWLPNSMGIDPANEKCIAFYKKIRESNMVLLVHVGHENSIDMGGVIQEYGNPLRLRCPLDQGVKVIAAHCASEGSNIDLDSEDKHSESNFRLFLRLMDEEKYKSLLYADISSMTAFKRVGEPLTTILARKDLHGRLVNGSDYVVPAIRMVVSTRLLAYQKYITYEEQTILNEIYEYNPLLFDYICKRRLRVPAGNDNEGTLFSASVFMLNKDLFANY
eukprot:TRINITY_DN6121_c0_g1_i1.p1 TRINITY_DN6121_c0_g1~~TRINITY_DN6121_c0_g1_i1.p1  ORF type:complete len:416 (-),score=119.87 TRINITY_DN6121_c0_g1_i1:128-1354(-)